MAIRGDGTPTDDRFVLVASRFNEEVVAKLVDGAQAGLHKHGVAQSDVELHWVPGAFELPLAAKKLAETNRFAAIICLGAVIRGDTDHYDHVCTQAASGIMQVGLATGVPVLFGVLTCDTEEQALDRAGGKAGNKGYDVALAAVEMVTLLKEIPGKS
jgi:6,7-dimethyl-8-ribityllumazine synthase